MALLVLNLISSEKASVRISDTRIVYPGVLMSELSYIVEWLVLGLVMVERSELVREASRLIYNYAAVPVHLISGLGVVHYE